MVRQEQQLQIKMSQKLVLTPQLQQSIKLLQLPLLELSQSLNQELMNNPFLEEVTEREPLEKKAQTDERHEDEIPEKPSDDTETPLEKIFGYTTDNYFEERETDGRDLGYFNDGSEATTLFERNVKKPDLYEHLLWQLRLSNIPESIGHVIEIIINNLNEYGYLEASLDEVAKASETDIQTAEKALSLMQGFDPAGVGARNLQECLILQLKPLELQDTLVEKILRHGFNELERKNLKQLASKFNASLDDISAAVKIIEGLEPRPGRNYSSEEANYITPDVFVEESDGKYVITLNNEGTPRLRISAFYRKLLSNKKTLGREEIEFLREKLRSALWLLKSLDQRNKTIYRVESTISRVTSSKYIQCPQGLISFKFFFSNALSSSDGNVPSSAVKETIRQLIEKEDQLKPYSDKKIAEILSSKGIEIARRTVAKYRDELKLPSHTKRKKWTRQP
ncbi:MAG: RNA polymerase sigma-54 factor [Nitrospirae bacterium]|nr:RNA polymerase sigma-54 factor [Nitrospirota bacterium]